MNKYDKDIEEMLRTLIEAEQEAIEEAKEKPESRDVKTVICKICGVKDTWHCYGTFPNGIKIWTDSNGLTCNGRMCGTCNQKRAQKTMKETRARRYPGRGKRDA